MLCANTPFSKTPTFQPSVIPSDPQLMPPQCLCIFNPHPEVTLLPEGSNAAPVALLITHPQYPQALLLLLLLLYSSLLYKS